jgi:hypothetical protein
LCGVSVLGIPVRWAVSAAAVAFIAAVVLVAIGVIAHWQPTAAEEQRALYRACQTFITNRLDTWTTADFPATADVVHLALPFQASQWHVRGTFVERSGTNPPIRASFLCDVSTDGAVVQVLGVTIQN